MSFDAVVYLALLFVAGCSSQTPQPVVQVVSPSPTTSSTPLPPALQPSASPYFNRPFYPQPYFGGAPAPAYFGGPQPAYFGAPAQFPQPFIGTSQQQRFVNGPYATGPVVPILQQTFDITPEGSYTFSFQSADGTQRQESGGLKYPSVQGLLPVMSVQGSYSSITPEGVPIEVSYIADENGYQPSGPGIHPAIQRAVAQQVAQAKQEQTQPGLIK